MEASRSFLSLNVTTCYDILRYLLRYMALALSSKQLLGEVWGKTRPRRERVTLLQSERNPLIAKSTPGLTSLYVLLITVYLQE